MGENENKKIKPLPFLDIRKVEVIDHSDKKPICFFDPKCAEKAYKKI